MATSKKDAPQDAQPSVQFTTGRAPGKALRILAKREGFRRAGFGFGSEPVTIALNDITEAQEDLLRGEPMLLVADIDIAEPVSADAAVKP